MTPMATVATKFRIDVSIRNLLQDSKGNPRAAEPEGLTLPVPVFPQYPEKLNDPGPERAPEGNRKWGMKPICRAMRGLAISLRTIACVARRLPPHHVVPLCRVQGQSGLLV